MLVTLASIFFYGAAGRDGGRRGTGAGRWGSGEPGGGGWGRMVSLRPVPARCLRGAWPRGWLRLRAVRLPAVRAGLCTGSLPRPAAPRRRHVPMQRARTGTKPHGRQGGGGARACWRAAACRPTRSASAGRCCCVSLWGVRTGASVASEAEKRGEALPPALQPGLRGNSWRVSCGAPSAGGVFRSCRAWIGLRYGKGESLPIFQK